MGWGWNSKLRLRGNEPIGRKEQAGVRTGARYQKTGGGSSLHRWFQTWSSESQVSQTTSRGFPNNEVFSAKESLKLLEGSVYLLSALHPGIKTSFEGKRQGCVCVCVCVCVEVGSTGQGKEEGREGKRRGEKGRSFS